MSEERKDGEGGPERALHFSKVRLSVRALDGSKRTILHGVSGTVRSGALTAVMGLSGSGKTSLIEALGGALGSKGASLSGAVEYANVGRCVVGFQKARLLPNLTVRQTLQFAATMQLENLGDVEAGVEAMIDRMELRNAAEGRVGDVDSCVEISGGERRRCYLGQLLFGDPDALLLDEPTTGLDSVQGLHVAQILRDISQQHHPHAKIVLASIHQPSSATFALFDEICLIHGGRLVFGGSTTAALDHFETLGFGCPARYNAADHFLDMLSMDDRSPGASSRTRSLLKSIMGHAKSSFSGTAKSCSSVVGSSSDEPVRTWVEQVGALLKRSPSAVDGKVLSVMVFSSTVCAMTQTLFFKGNDDGNGPYARAKSTFGLCAVVCINIAHTDCVYSAYSFERERKVVIAESGLYSVSAYCFARQLVALPVLFLPGFVLVTIIYWAAIGSGDWPTYLSFLALAWATSTSFEALGRLSAALGVFEGTNLSAFNLQIVPMLLLLSGIYFPTSAISSPFIRKLSVVSPVRWTLQAMLSLEFGSQRYHSNSAYLTSKDDLVSHFLGGLEPISTGHALLALAMHSLCSTVLTSVLVGRARRKKRHLAPPTDEEEEEVEFRSSVVVVKRNMRQSVVAKRLQSMSAQGKPRFFENNRLSQQLRRLSWEDAATGCGETLNLLLPKRSADLRYERVELVLNDQRTVLSGISGRVKGAALTAVMGPSGCGKTSLLRCLAGKLPPKGIFKLAGKMTKTKITLVEASDDFFPGLTVRETLELTAALELPQEKARNRDTCKRTCEALAKQFHLLSGNDAAGGIEQNAVYETRVSLLSGGERRRLLLASRLLSNPTVLLADEPTCGLDAFQALTVVQMLELLARRARRTVALSLNAPRSAIFCLLDEIHLLTARGSILYAGPAAQILHTLESRGLAPCPFNVNPTDHLLNLTSNLDSLYECNQQNPPKYVAKKLVEEEEQQEVVRHLAKWARELRVGWSRALKSRLRAPQFWRIELGLSGMLAVYLLAILKPNDSDQTSLGVLTGLLYFLASTQGMRMNGLAINARSAPSLTILVGQQLAEFSLSSLSCIVGLVGCVLGGLGFGDHNIWEVLGHFLLFGGVCWLLGLATVALVDSHDDAGANAATRTLIGAWAQLVLSSGAGFFRPLESMRKGARWLGQISHFRWLLNGTAQLTLHGKRFGCEQKFLLNFGTVLPSGCKTGDDLLGELQYARFSARECALAALSLCLAWTALAWLALMRPPKFLTLPPTTK